MRCRKHLSDFSSNIGVCSTCLREKLLFLIETQSQLNSISVNPNPNFSNQNQNQSQPLIFPRSVSPYITRRKSDQTANIKPQIVQRFYSTPQVATKKSVGKFNLITKLFRSRSTASSELGVRPAELTRWRNRGMSPENELEESPARRTRPSPGRVKASPARLASNVASFAFCLSPLVRACPASRYGGEPSFSGEIRVPANGNSSSSTIGGNNIKSGGVNSKKPQLYEAASYCANRSRKLADFGRLNRNR